MPAELCNLMLQGVKIMLNCIGDYLRSLTFSDIAVTLGVFSDIAVLALAGYTLYITAFARKLEFISISSSTNLFFGQSMAFYLINKSLHALPVQSVFILKRYGRKFYHISFAEFNEPLIIESWNIRKVCTGEYTEIENWGDVDKPSIIPDEIIKDAVIGVEVGKMILWVKPYQNAPLKQAKKAFKKHQFKVLTVSKRRINNIVLSPAVNCHIGVRIKDINGQYILKEVFGILATEDDGHLLLSDALCGYTAFHNCGNGAATIKAKLKERLGIDDENIAVTILRSNGAKVSFENQDAD